MGTGSRLHSEQPLRNPDFADSSPAERSAVETMAALARERDFSAAVLDTVANLVVVLDREGQFVRFNRACEQVTGYSFAEVEGRSLWDLFLLDDEASTVKQVFASLVAGHFPSTHENYWKTKHGEQRLIAWTNTALLDEQGMVTHVIATGRDVTEQRQVEENLQRYRILAMNARDIVLLFDREGSLLEANDAAVKAYGYSYVQLIGMRVTDLRAPDTAEVIRAQLAQADNGGILFETVHRRSDGSTFPVEVSSQGADIAGKRVVLSIVRDISERKRAEAERARLLAEMERNAAQLRVTISSAADGLVVYDPEGRILTINDAAINMLGYNAEHIALPQVERLVRLRLRTPDGKPMPPEKTPFFRALRGETVQGLVAVVHRATRQRWLSISAAPVRTEDGQFLGAVASLSDTTTLHELQEQREDFIRTITHDLRSPLSVISGMTEWLHRRLSQKKGLEREAGAAEKALKSANRMNAMVSDLLESVRLESGSLNLQREPLDLAGLVADAMERIGAPEERARLRVEPADGLPLVYADAGQVERAVINLASNALKYSPGDAPVVVRLYAQEDQVVVSVVDCGPGISPSELPHLFQRFFRARSTVRSEGLGLGLYITRLIAEAHGGRAWVESEPGRGSAFHVSFPVAKGEGQ